MSDRNERAEARLARATAPTCYRFARLRRWRWDVTYHRPVETAHPGVPDGRLHLSGRSGHTFTWLGAAVALARHLRRVAP